MGVISIQAENLMCSLSGVSGGHDFMGLLSAFLPSPKCEFSHMLSIMSKLLLISLLLISHFGIAILTREQTNPRTLLYLIIKYMYFASFMITTKVPSCLPQSEVSEGWDLNKCASLSSRSLLFSELLCHRNVLVSKKSAMLAGVAVCCPLHRIVQLLIITCIIKIIWLFFQVISGC